MGVTDDGDDDEYFAKRTTFTPLVQLWYITNYNYFKPKEFRESAKADNRHCYSIIRPCATVDTVDENTRDRAQFIIIYCIRKGHVVL